MKTVQSLLRSLTNDNQVVQIANAGTSLLMFKFTVEQYFAEELDDDCVSIIEKGRLTGFYVDSDYSIVCLVEEDRADMQVVHEILKNLYGEDFMNCKVE